MKANVFGSFATCMELFLVAVMMNRKYQLFHEEEGGSHFIDPCSVLKENIPRRQSLRGIFFSIHHKCQ